MMTSYQVTLFNTTGEYRPVSCIVKKEDKVLIEMGQEAFIKMVRQEGIQKICMKRYWTSKDLKKYGYTRAKVREYNKERIQREQEERYEQIKKERGWT